MAGYRHQIIPIEKISEIFPYRVRFQDEVPEALVQSVKKRGVLQPLLLSGNRIVAGHRRFLAAKKAGLFQVDVLETQSQLSDADAFLLAVISNWNQYDLELDQAFIIHQAEALGLNDSDILEEIFPALGLESQKSYLEEMREIMKLDASLLEKIQEGKMPFRGARTLRRFSAADQKEWARVSNHVVFTTNQLLKLGDWLYDLGKSSGVGLTALLKKSEIQEVLTQEADRKSKGERFFQAVRKIRFPNVDKKEKDFEGLSRQLGAGQSDLAVEAPTFFEAEGFTLRARIRNQKSLDDLRSVLEHKRKVLNSLLDIVL